MQLFTHGKPGCYSPSSSRLELPSTEPPPYEHTKNHQDRRHQHDRPKSHLHSSLVSSLPTNSTDDLHQVANVQDLVEGLCGVAASGARSRGSRRCRRPASATLVGSPRRRGPDSTRPGEPLTAADTPAVPATSSVTVPGSRQSRRSATNPGGSLEGAVGLILRRGRARCSNAERPAPRIGLEPTTLRFKIELLTRSRHSTNTR
jgi:hypothetical protein